MEKNDNIYRAEIRRLQKAAKEKDWTYLTNWLRQFDEQVRQDYENAFQKELGNAIENFCVAIAYALRFSEKTKFGNKRIGEFMDDVFTSVDMFARGEYSPDDYKKELLKSGVTLFNKKGEKENG